MPRYPMLSPRQTRSARQALMNDLERLIEQTSIHDLLHALTAVCFTHADQHPHDRAGDNWRDIGRHLTAVEDFTARLTL